jgi:glycosyltransferase involved in cell wall biosynthesis
MKIFTLFGFAFPNKGFEYAILALYILMRRRRTDVRLLIISGEHATSVRNDYLAGLKKLVWTHRLNGRVEFTGYVASGDLKPYFDRTFCFLFPYLHRDTPSGAISTALHTGKPVIVSNIRAFQEYDGLLNFAEKDAEGLADKMEQLMDDPNLLKCAIEATRLNREAFSMENVFQQHVDIYRNVCEK